jgi:ABC-type transporter Mla subunit MlaD
MALGGDPDDIRDEARRLRRVAASIESEAATVSRGQGVHWHGAAGDRYRERLARHARAIRDGAGEAGDAASELQRLADALEERQAAIRRAMNFVGDLIDSARRTINSMAGEALDALSDAERAAHDQAQRLLSSTRHHPSPGDPAWLDLARKLG